ncbi:MAG: HEAT repeat domain-containing protein [Edaphobacter sp.]
MQTFVRAFAITTVLAAASSLFAQQPTITHGQVVMEAADHGLKTAIDSQKRQKDAGWLGYSVPIVSKFSSDWNSRGIDYLEGNGDSIMDDSEGSRRTADRAVILLRIADGAVMKVKVESPDRSLDAGGLRFVWLNGVTEDDSIRLLTDLARQGDVRHLRDSAVFAISIHQSNSATAALVGLAGTGSDLELREKAVFWLANQRGHDGLAAIQRFARGDNDPKFREKLTFDLTLTKDPEALNELIRMAHEDTSPRVRKQAQFWMATKGGKKVSQDLRTIATDDPNEQIRKSAVFALSRLPGDEAATQLIAVADSSKDPAVRRQAVFWLGQSNDPRALDYLTKLLKQ